MSRPSTRAAVRLSANGHAKVPTPAPVDAPLHYCSRPAGERGTTCGYALPCPLHDASLPAPGPAPPRAPAPAQELPGETRIDLDLEHAQELLEQVLTDEALADHVPQFARAELLAAACAIARARVLTEALADGLLTEPTEREAAQDLDTPLRCRDCGGPAVAAPAGDA